MNKHRLLMTRTLVVFLSVLVLLPAVANAEQLEPEPLAPGAIEALEELALDTAEADAPMDEAEQGEDWHHVVGPADLYLRHDISLSLPEGYVFIEKASANKILEAMGNFDNDAVLGLVVSNEEDSTYFVVIEYFDPGWVDDNEDLDAGDLLEALQEAQQQANVTRQARGFDPLTIDDWADKPYYNRALHHLIWAMYVSDGQGTSINYSTRILGRRGFVSLNLVTEEATLEVDKNSIQALLDTTKFSVGARYEDFDPDNDKNSGLGIGALIAGGAIATKLGFFAKIGKFLLMLLFVFKKFFIFIIAGAGLFFKRIFGGKNNDVVPVDDLLDVDDSNASYAEPPEPAIDAHAEVADDDV